MEIQDEARHSVLPRTQWLVALHQRQLSEPPHSGTSQPRQVAEDAISKEKRPSSIPDPQRRFDRAGTTKFCDVDGCGTCRHKPAGLGAKRTCDVVADDMDEDPRR